jgi:hypothetical protein
VVGQQLPPEMMVNQSWLYASAVLPPFSKGLAAPHLPGKKKESILSPP